MEESATERPALQTTSLYQVPGVRQLLLLVGIAASVAVGVAVALWSQGPNLRTLYPTMEPGEAMEVARALDALDVQYQLDPTSGALMAPAERIQEIQMLLAEQGLPRTSGISLESLGAGNGFGTSQFMESKLYTHALENRLADVIGSLTVIRSAKVSLGLPRESVFVRRRKEPTASVLVHLYPGRHLERSQVDAIVHLVASSIPGLEAGRVTVLDQRSTLLTRNGSDALGRSASQFDYQRQVEHAYVENITNLLLPLMGEGRVRAQVVARMDFTESEQTTERFDPASQVIRSEQTNERQETKDLAQAGGIPGARSNQPGAKPSTQPNDAAETPRSITRDIVRNYELDKTISRTRQPTGRIQRLSVAVLLDYLPAQAKSEESRALSDGELDEVTTLVKEAVGFDETRGDTLHVINTAFQTPPEPKRLKEPALWQQAWALDIAKQILGAVVVLALGLGLVRPLLRSLTQSAAPAAALPALQEQRTKLSAPQDPMMLAQDLAASDPQRVAQVVKGWVAGNE